MRLLRGLWRALRWTLAALGGLWSVLMMLLMAGSLVLSIAMAVIPAVFAAVSGAVEAVSGIKSLHSRQIARETTLIDNADRAERRATLEAAERRAATSRADNLAREVADGSAAQSRLARELADSRAAQSRMARELADAQVTYRGSRKAAREAVKDTATRVARRSSIAAGRNLGSMAGEALPLFGVGVIAAATAWELADACGLMRDMRELDAAFNPGDPITDDEVCGLKPPTREQLLAAIKASPRAAWDTATGLYGALPEVSVAAAYGYSRDTLSWAWGGIFGADAQLSMAPDIGDRGPAPSDLNPLNWFDGK